MSKSTSIFAALVAAFLAYVYFVEFKGTQKKEQTEAEQSKILNFKVDDVQSFTLTKESGNIQVDRTTDGWSLSSPIQDKGSKESIEGFLNTLFGEKSDGVAAEGNDIGWMIYGLEKPQATLEIKVKDKTAKVILGTVSGVSGMRYIRIGDENKVRMVTATVESELNKTAKDFREKSVFRLPADKFIKVSVDGLTVEKSGGDWVMDGIYREDSDKSQIASYVRSVASINAQDFASEEKSKFKLPAGKKVEITLDDGKRMWVQIYQNKDKHYLTLQDRNTVYEITKVDFDTFSKTANDFRDKKKPFEFEESKVSQIDYKTEGLNLNLKKEGDKWTAKEPVNNEKVKELFERLRGLQVQKFYGKNKGGMYHPKGTITLKDEAGSVVFDFKWGNDDTKNSVTVVKTNRNDELFGIPNTIVTGLPGKSLLKNESNDKEEKHGEDPSHQSDTH